jgi:HK97 family phage major capsid protein
MARIDLSVSNGWIPEETDSKVIQKLESTSAIEAVARRVPMTSQAVRVPRFAADGVSIVPEGGLIPQADAELDTVLLEANKWADRFTISEEDNADAVVNFLDAAKASWVSDFARELDNAALGVTADVTGPGTNIPFQSVYNAVSDAGQVEATAGNLEFEMLNDAFTTLESGDYNGDLVIIAHPSFKGALRNLKDADGTRVVDNVLGGGQPTIFGYNLVFSTGARTSATATHAPAGNPLLIVGNSQHLLLGVRSGPESQVAAHRWEYDERELKVRARRGFAVATGEAFVVLEKTGA